MNEMHNDENENINSNYSPDIPECGVSLFWKFWTLIAIILLVLCYLYIDLI